MAETAQTLPPDTQLFRDVFNASAIGIVVENFEGQPLFANPAFCSMLGFSEEEICHKHCVQFSPPEDAEKDWALFQQLRAGSIDHYQLEKRYFRRDGSLVWGRLSLSLLKSGPSPLVLAMVEDISDKKKAEEAQFRHAAIVESSEDAIMSVTLDRTISTWNTGAERIYGYTEAEALGQPIDMIVPPELSDEENKILDTLRAGGRIEQLETVRITKTGKRINVSLSISPIKSTTGDIVGCSGIARDITERKRAEEALRTSEERLRLAQQAALIGTFEWNIQTGVNTWTPELEAMYGLPPGGFGGTHAAFESLVYEDDRAGLRALVESTLKTGQPTKGEWRVVWPDGSVHWLAAYWQVLMDESGQPSEVIGVNMDITERKLAEKTLWDSEERFRLAAQAGKMYAYEWDVATDIIVRSGDIGRVLASTDEASLTRQQLLARVHPDDRVLFNASVRERTPENPDVQISYRLLRPDGSVVWLEKTAHAFFDEHSRMVRMIGMVADITERRRAEEALREYERAVELSEEAMAVVDRDYRFLIANRKYLRLRKMTKEQVVGHFVPEVLNKGVFEGVVKEKLDQCFQGKVVRYEMKYTYPELGEREVLVSYFPIEGANGVDRVASIMQDITDSKRLERVLTDMSRKLIEAQEQERARIARELHDDIGQRLALMSVELDRQRDIPPEAQSRAQDLRKELSQISEDVQALSHELHDSKLEYLGAIAAIRSWCTEFAERQRIDIDFKSSVQSVLPVELGRTLLRVLQEALHNAVKHSGVKRVEVRLMEQSNQVHLIVSDSGKGFDIESAMQGKGLGLASMRERVKLVNGTIAIESKPMSGTTIEVRVPLEAQHRSQRAS